MKRFLYTHEFLQNHSKLQIFLEEKGEQGWELVALFRLENPFSYEVWMRLEVPESADSGSDPLLSSDEDGEKGMGPVFWLLVLIGILALGTWVISATF